MPERTSSLVMNMFSSKEDFIVSFKSVAMMLYGKALEETDSIEKYLILGQMVKSYMLDIWRKNRHEIRKNEKKNLYYFSMEFLLGKI